jgi:hypothetical protein
MAAPSPSTQRISSDPCLGCVRFTCVYPHALCLSLPLSLSLSLSHVQGNRHTYRGGSGRRVGRGRVGGRWRGALPQQRWGMCLSLSCGTSMMAQHMCACMHPFPATPRHAYSLLHIHSNLMNTHISICLAGFAGVLGERGSCSQ